MTIDYHGPAQVRSIRIPDSLWKEIKKYHEVNRTYSWDNLSDTIRLLITAGLEHLEKKEEPESPPKKRRKTRIHVNRP